MAEDLFGLTANDVLRLRNALAYIETQGTPPLTNTGRRQLQPSRIIVGALTSSVAATTSLLGKPKVGNLNVYSFTSTGTVDTGLDETVYNFAPHPATTDRWTVAERDSYTGKFVITTQFCS